MVWYFINISKCQDRYHPAFSHLTELISPHSHRDLALLYLRWLIRVWSKMYGGDEEYDEEEEEITQEDAWAVISAYFEEKGLVRQQLDSFDEFIQNTMQEIVDESSDIEIRPESQHNPGRNTETGDV